MNEKDIMFLDLYKRMDKLCLDMFGVHGGISQYILEMEKETSGIYKVSNWNEDYKSLKHLRWVRNRIAHDCDMAQICDDSDLAQIQNFYEKILQCKDPLTKFRKCNKVKRRKSKYCNTKGNSQISSAVVGAIIVLILIVLLAFVLSV